MEAARSPFEVEVEKPQLRQVRATEAVYGGCDRRDGGFSNASVPVTAAPALPLSRACELSPIVAMDSDGRVLLHLTSARCDLQDQAS
jgi:hypothetical protein